jgi:hypothetical protein
VGVIFDRASLGLVGAVTIMLFGFASVPLLGSGKTVSGFRIGDSVFRYDDGNAALFLAQTYSPTLDLSTFLPAFPPRSLSRPHRFDRMGATPDFELPSPDHGASATPPQFTEVSVSEQGAAGLLTKCARCPTHCIGACRPRCPMKDMPRYLPILYFGSSPLL